MDIGGDQMTDTELLNIYIKKSGLKKEKIAEILGITPTSFSHKIHNKREFKQTEIKLLCGLLKIDDYETKEKVFFT